MPAFLTQILPRRLIRDVLTIIPLRGYYMFGIGYQEMFIVLVVAPGHLPGPSLAELPDGSRRRMFRTSGA